ncbi:MAG TPA: hypothetical protein VGY54_16640 [Polyangiaceae bacterium]|jgi:hypothetical protein|nr:hypothetical protein [Polyangiaceae bacterium]
MPNVERNAFPDEPPTKKMSNTPSALLAFASRVDRLAELALERLQVAPDAEAVAAALGELVQIRALTAGVLR